MTLGRLRGGSAPSRRLAHDSALWAGRWSSGVATLGLRVEAETLVAVAVGPGAGEALGSVPALVGLADDHQALVDADPPALARLARRRADYRMGATGDLTGALLPAVLGQRVTAGEAHGAWAQLCRVYGEAAPTDPVLTEVVGTDLVGTAPVGTASVGRETVGPALVGSDRAGGSDVLTVPPQPAVLARMTAHELHRFGVERSRGDLLIGLARRAPSLNRLVTRTPEEVRRVLCTLPGVGPWTASIATRVAMGDPDAVLLGDLHLPSTVAWALAGEARADDDEMLELLAPYAGHRARVQQLIKVAGIRAPRRGPRYRPLPIARM